MPETLPPAIQRFFEATNAGDRSGVLAAFAASAVLDDWGRVFHGHAGIAQWDETDNVGVNSHLTVEDTDIGRDEVIVRVSVRGQGFNGQGRMIFRMEGGLISALTIS
jgi:hypothetical protein